MPNLNNFIYFKAELTLEISRASKQIPDVLRRIQWYISWNENLDCRVCSILVFAKHFQASEYQDTVFVIVAM